MAQQIVQLGTGPGTPGADSQYEAHRKHKENTAELYGLMLSGATGSVFRTPLNSGFTVDPNGSADSTAGLNAFCALLASTGDPGFLPPGTYRTTAEVVYPNGYLYFIGAGPARCVIKPDANTYNGVRINAGTGTGLGGSLRPQGIVGGFCVRGPNASPPQNGKAGFVLDATTQCVVRDVLVEGFDIGFDQINNCFNSNYENIFTSRNVGTVNVGYNARTDNQNGCDICFYNAQLTGKLAAMCFSGTGGGYRVFGGSFGTSQTAVLDKLGVITMGWNYISDVEAGGLGSMLFTGLHIEGWRGQHAFRVYGSVTFGVQGTGFNPSASDVPASGIVHHSNAQGSSQTWLHNDIGNGYFSSNAVATITGENDDFQMLELGWASSSMASVGGTSRNRSWMKSLLRTSNTFQGGDPKWMRGLSYYSDAYPVLLLGRMHVKPDAGAGTWAQSFDGTNWDVFGRPFAVSEGGTNHNVEPWYAPGRITMTSASANTVTVRTDATATCPVGTKVQVVQAGSGNTTITPSGGVTINRRVGLRLAGQHAVAFIEKVGTNAWIAYGDLIA
jgi:hypothetical protein